MALEVGAGFDLRGVLSEVDGGGLDGEGEAAERLYYFGSGAFFFGGGEDLIGLMLTNELQRVERFEAVEGEELARCWQAGEVALRQPGSEKCVEPFALEECRSLRGAEEGWAVHVVEDEQCVAFAFALAQDALGLLAGVALFGLGPGELEGFIDLGEDGG